MPELLRIAPLLHKVTIVVCLLSLKKHANKALQAGKKWAFFSLLHSYCQTPVKKISMTRTKKKFNQLTGSLSHNSGNMLSVSIPLFYKIWKNFFFSIIFSNANTWIGAVCGCMPYHIFSLSRSIVWHSEANTFILEPQKNSVGSTALHSTRCQIVSEFGSSFCHSLRQDATCA